jgi:DegV family protein with EDD domain
MKATLGNDVLRQTESYANAARSRAMTPVAVVTDTTHYLPRPLADLQGIHQVSLYVGWKGELERELEIDSLEGFYERLRTDAELPATSQPSIGDFLAVWEPLIEAGKDIASIHLGGGISGTCEVARQARDLLQERGLVDRIEVIDGETGAGGLGCLLLAAAAFARSGARLNEMVARVHESRQVLNIRFCIDTLEYLQRGGRIGKAQAWLGCTLKIKPILSFEREVTPVERVRTGGRAFERMVEYMREMHHNGADGWVVQHIQAPDQARRLVERGREIYGSEPLFVSEVGPVIGTYIGPGGLLVAGIPRALVA